VGLGKREVITRTMFEFPGGGQSPLPWREKVGGVTGRKKEKGGWNPSSIFGHRTTRRDWIQVEEKLFSNR